MSEQPVTFPSAGLELSGAVHVPRGMRASERRAGFLVLHGFGSNKTSSNTMQPTRVLGELGYVVLRFDMRGCGDSGGERGRVICLEQVEDTPNAVTFLAAHPAVDPQRIAVIGSSFGGAVAVYAAGVDERLAAVISNGGWGDGERKFRGQHRSPQEWARFTDMLRQGREQINQYPQYWRRCAVDAALMKDARPQPFNGFVQLFVGRSTTEKDLQILWCIRRAVVCMCQALPRHGRDGSTYTLQPGRMADRRGIRPHSYVPIPPSRCGRAREDTERYRCLRCPWREGLHRSP